MNPEQIQHPKRVSTDQLPMVKRKIERDLQTIYLAIENLQRANELVFDATAITSGYLADNEINDIERYADRIREHQEFLVAAAEVFEDFNVRYRREMQRRGISCRDRV